ALFIATIASTVWAIEPSKSQFTLPLQNGRLNLRDVVTRVGEELGINAAGAVKDIDWSIDVQSLLGKIQLNVFDRLAAGAVTTDVHGNAVIVTIDRADLKKKLIATGNTIDGW